MTTRDVPPRAAVPPTYRFAQTGDGMRIGYCLHGTGPPFVFVRGWVSHLELMWEDSDFRAFFEPIARHFQLLRFDNRGNGISERAPERIDFEALVEDLEAVVDAAHLERFILHGAAFGAPIAIAYAARHPERVSHLVLAQPYLRGSEVLAPRHREAFVRNLRENPEAMSLQLARRTQPDPDAKVFVRADRIWRSVTPDTASRLYDIGFSLDVTSEATAVRCPTLVLHRRDGEFLRLDVGARVAARIPGAEFVPLEGRAGNLWEGQQEESLRAIGRFIGVDLLDEVATPELTPVTVLFTDIEASTSITQQLGDDRAQELVRLHDRVVREQLQRHGGHAIKHTGDGIMASFRSCTQAVDCAVAIQRGFEAIRQQGPETAVHIRIGLNAGEPLAEDGDLFGTAVQLARRICDHAGTDAILVASVVREMVAGRGFLLRDAGSAELRGFAEPVHLFEVDWR